MRHRFNKKIIFYIVFLFIIMLNLQLLATSFSWNPNYSKSKNVVNSHSEIGSLPNYSKISTTVPNNQIASTQNHTISNLLNYNFTLDC